MGRPTLKEAKVKDRDAYTSVYTRMCFVKRRHLVRCLTESCHNTSNFLGRYRMNDEQKTKEQLSEELAAVRTPHSLKKFDTPFW